MLGLQLNNEVAAIQVLLEFLDKETNATMRRRINPVKQI